MARRGKLAKFETLYPDVIMVFTVVDGKISPEQLAAISGLTPLQQEALFDYLDTTNVALTATHLGRFPSDMYLTIDTACKKTQKALETLKSLIG